MKLSAPKQITWWIALIIACVSVLARFVAIPVLSAHCLLIMGIAFALLWLATFVKGL